MHDKKINSDLLEIIRHVFATDISPNLPETQHLTAKMIQHGLDIASRDLKQAPKEGTNLTTLSNQNTANLRATLELENMAKDIREQKYDSNLLGPIVGILEDQIKRRLELSNPDYLTNRKFSQPKAN
jgi:hypothetical protein